MNIWVGLMSLIKYLVPGFTLNIKLSKRVINCTPEHKILSTKGYIEAKNLGHRGLIASDILKEISKTIKQYECN